ncbi:MAG: hypothetical protein AAF065_11960 [Verrucomicrobiota bacterium]
MARKDNSNSIASRLSRIELDAGRNAFDEVRDWLSIENMSYDDAVEKIEEEFKESTSTGALTNFFQKHCVGFKHKRARDLASDVRKVFEEDSECDFSQLTLQKIEQRAFEEAFAKDANIEELESLSRILGASAKLKLAQRKLELDIDKFRDATKSSIEKGLDALLQEIKGNPDSLALFEKLKASVMESVEGTSV